MQRNRDSEETSEGRDSEETSEDRGDKISRVKLNSHQKLYQFTLFLYGVVVRCDKRRFRCTVHL